MSIELPPLPYATDALEPRISRATLQVHYGKHHKAYIDTTNALIAGTILERMSLEHIVRSTAGRKSRSSVFNAAAQAWNHDFHWHSMSPDGGGAPTSDIRSQIERDFKTVDQFAKAFHTASLKHFGSGWAWLVLGSDGLEILTTSNADTPLVHEKVPILALDLWEHAYYLDYQNRRSDYISNYLASIVNWEFANANLKRGFAARLAAE